MINVDPGQVSILLVTGRAMSAARMVIKIGGAELGRAILMLVLSVDSGIGENSFMIFFFQDVKGFNEGSVSRVHTVNDEMEVERKMRVRTW